MITCSIDSLRALLVHEISKPPHIRDLLVVLRERAGSGGSKARERVRGAASGVYSILDLYLVDLRSLSGLAAEGRATASGVAHLACGSVRHS